MENRKITVASSPHIKSNLRVNRIMLDVIIALVPVAAAGIYFNGIKGLLLIAVTVLGCMGTEVLFKKLLHKKHSLNDLSAVVTGLILALILPVDTPLWVALLSAIFAISLVKEIFGGLGQNFMNPAAAAKIFAVVSYGTLVVNKGFEGVSIQERLVGSAGGNLGEASIIAILVGGLYLAVKGIIRARVPFMVLLVSFVFSAVVLGDVTILAGNSGIYLVAFFLANDYASSSITNPGKWIYAAFVGLTASLFIGLSKNIEGAYYAVLIGNVFAPFIDSFFEGKVDTKKGATA